MRMNLGVKLGLAAAALAGGAVLTACGTKGAGSAAPGRGSDDLDAAADRWSAGGAEKPHVLEMLKSSNRSAADAVKIADAARKTAYEPDVQFGDGKLDVDGGLKSLDAALRSRFSADDVAEVAKSVQDFEQVTIETEDPKVAWKSAAPKGNAIMVDAMTSAPTYSAHDLKQILDAASKTAHSSAEVVTHFHDTLATGKPADKIVQALKTDANHAVNLLQDSQG